MEPHTSRRKRGGAAAVGLSMLAAAVGGVAVLGAVTAGSAGTAAAASTSASVFFPVNPTRVLDTRPSSHIGGFGTTQYTQPFAGNDRAYPVQVAGPIPGSPQTAPVPAGATAVVMNVTVTNPTLNSLLRVFPHATAPPNASNLNYPKGRTIPNLVTVRLSSDGAVDVTQGQGTADVIFDVVGYYQLPGGSTASGAPSATGSSSGTATPSSTVSATTSGTATPTISTSGTATPSTSVSATTSGTATPTSSVSATTSRSATPASSGGGVPTCAPGVPVPTLGCPSSPAAGQQPRATSSAAGSVFTPVAPTRVLDTRNGIGSVDGSTSGPRAPFAGNDRVYRVQVAGGVPGATSVAVPTGANAVVMNVTVTRPTINSLLRVFPADPPRASNLNYRQGETIPNLVVVPLASDGRVGVTQGAGLADVIFDVVGYFTAATTASGTPTTSNSATTTASASSSGGPVPSCLPNAPVPVVGCPSASGTASSSASTTASASTSSSASATTSTSATPSTSASSGASAIPSCIPGSPALGCPSASGSATPSRAAGGAGGESARATTPTYPGNNVFVPVDPSRILDTRAKSAIGGPSATATYATPFRGSGQPGRDNTYFVQVTGSIANGGAPVPSGATAVVLNATVTNPTVSSLLRIFPSNQQPPNASNLNYSAGETIPNLVTVPIGPDGRVGVTQGAGSADVVFDVVGYYVSGNGSTAPPTATSSSTTSGTATPSSTTSTGSSATPSGTSSATPSSSMGLPTLPSGGVPTLPGGGSGTPSSSATPTPSRT